ncbi:MAG TPA: hypothetical protein VFP80_08725 [Thermoanaerobaculia bacterium]|nr:hypothetical protein [Thermoanaerobaculia bacterium]
MSKGSLLALLITLSTILPAEGRLGRPLRVVPPRYGPLDNTYLGALSYDGKNFLFNARTAASLETSTKVLFVVGPDGTQLGDPVLVPLGAEVLGITEGLYIVLLGDSFLRLSARGEWLDAGPLPLPVHAEDGAAGSRRFLVLGEGQSFLVDFRGNAVPAGPHPGHGFVSAKDRLFAVAEYVGGVCQLRMLDDEGRILRDGPAPSGGCGLGTDGNTWLLYPTTAALPYRIVDDDLNVLVTFDEDTFLFPFRGWGYLGVSDRLSRFPHPSFPARVFELRAGSYATQTTTLLDRVFGSSQVFGNGHTLLYLERETVPQRARLFSSIAELQGSLPPPLSFTGGRDREVPVAATNSAGVSLLVWNEPEPESSSAIYAARVSAAGALLDAHPLLLSTECRDARSAIATDGTDFLVGWAGCGRVGAHLVTAEGIATTAFTAPRNGLSVENLPAVAFDGQSYVMVWPDADYLAFARILRNGSSVRPGTARMRGRSPQVAARPGGGWLLVYSDELLNRLTSQPLTPDATLTGAPESIVRSFAKASSLIRRDDGFLLVARPPRAEDEPFLIRLDEGGKASSQPVDIPAGTATPRMFCGSECVLVWREDDSENLGRIVAAPVREPAPRELALGEPVTVGTHDAIFRIGEPVLFRGSVDDPRLLLYTAPDGESGAIQIFARTAEAKRRASRP